ncbi:Uncharacterised protein [Serratia quinivorans]|nr:Uncharacterised protein [Serratia quinivorans]
MSENPVYRTRQSVERAIAALSPDALAPHLAALYRANMRVTPLRLLYLYTIAISGNCSSLYDLEEVFPASNVYRTLDDLITGEILFMETHQGVLLYFNTAFKLSSVTTCVCCGGTVISGVELEDSLPVDTTTTF